MIERQNWLDVRAYLDYCERVLQLDQKTVKRKRTHLRHLLEWADSIPFQKVRSIDPTYPVYLRTSRNDNLDKPLSSATMGRACEEGRRFFTWARAEYPTRYRGISESWISTVKPDRAHGHQAELEGRVIWEYEDIAKIAQLKPENITEKRDIAATCFLFLSGMRIDAFITLPLDCVDLDAGRVKQLPGKGVRTKNHKAAMTYLLTGEDISQVIEVVKEWDGYIRTRIPSNGFWYPFLDTSGEINPEVRDAGQDRASLYRKGLRRLCNKAGVEYKSPHKLRHGHAVHAYRKATTIAQLKAISQNLMHKSLMITDSLYGVLTADNVSDNIRSLGGNQGTQEGKIDMDLLRKAVESILKNNSPSL